MYKHYRTFTDHTPQTKPSLNCKEATDLFLDKDLSPCQRKARLWELFKGRLTSEELMELALPQIAKMIQTSQFIYEKCKKNSGEIRKAPVKNKFIELSEHIFRTFPSLPKEIALSSSLCLTSLVSSVRDSTCCQLLPSSPGRRFSQFLDDRNAKKNLLQHLIIDNNSLACETILSCCGGKVFKNHEGLPATCSGTLALSGGYCTPDKPHVPELKQFQEDIVHQISTPSTACI